MEGEEREAQIQPSPSPRRKGGQPGNTNALKHGLYSATTLAARKARVDEGRAMKLKLAEVEVRLAELKAEWEATKKARRRRKPRGLG